MTDENVEIVELDGEIEQHRTRTYLAGPITNATDSARKAGEKLRNAIKQALKESRICFHDPYDPAEHTFLGSEHTAREVYSINFREVVKSDLIVLIASPQSHGVGIEAEIAAKSLVPRIIIRPEGFQLSRMIPGMSAITLLDIQYRGIRDCCRQLREGELHFAKQLAELTPRRRVALSLVRSAELGLRILRLRILNGLTRTELANRSLLTEEWIRSLELHDECAVGMTLMEQQQLADALGYTYRLPATPADYSSEAENKLTTQERESLNALAYFVRNRNIPNDNRINEIWSDYYEMCSEAVAARQDISRVFSEADWEAAYRRDNLFS